LLPLLTYIQDTSAVAIQAAYRRHLHKGVIEDAAAERQRLKGGMSAEPPGIIEAIASQSSSEMFVLGVSVSLSDQVLHMSRMVSAMALTSFYHDKWKTIMHRKVLARPTHVPYSLLDRGDSLTKLCHEHGLSRSMIKED
jgi:hypothetical protein